MDKGQFRCLLTVVDKATGGVRLSPIADSYLESRNLLDELLRGHCRPGMLNRSDHDRRPARGGAPSSPSAQDCGERAYVESVN